MSALFWRLRIALEWHLARNLFRQQWLIARPGVWRWMEGCFARRARSGDPQACDFYGHILLFRGQGLAARQEGLRLLGIAADAGQGKAAWQLGVQALQGDVSRAPDAVEAARRWEQALAAGHPLAARRLAALYAEGGPGLAADARRAAQYAQQDEQRPV